MFARRRTLGALGLTGALALTIGCTNTIDGPVELEDDVGANSLELVGELPLAGEPPRGMYVVTPPELVGPPGETNVVAAGQQRIIYLNKDGGTYSPGYNDSSANKSSIVNTTSQIPPWNVPAQAWDNIVACLQDQFSRFNVLVTDQDPGSATHVEAVIAGSPHHIGMQSGVGGVSPFSCGIIEKSINFTFAEVYGSSYQSICHTAAQEIAHSYGLDHELLCEDPMTYLTGCGAKTFKDQYADCGEYNSRQCQCGGSQQNSVQALYDALGAADEGNDNPPMVAIDDPQDGATVQQGFQVSVSASDDNGIDRVELYIDDQLADTDGSAPYQFTTDSSLPEGQHTVEAVAYDTAAATASDGVSVTVEADDPNDPNDPNDPDDPDDPNDPNDPNDPDDPDDPDDPNDPDGGIGQPCTDGDDCLSGLCATAGDQSLCTDLCSDSSSCPAGYSCQTTSGGEGVCWPDDGGGGSGGGSGSGPGDVHGGCNGSGSGSAGLLTLLLAAGLLARRRRSAA